MVTIRRFDAHEWRTYRDLRLRSLIDSPDAFGSTWAEEQQRTPEMWAARLAASADNNHPLVAELNGLAAGLCWAKVDADDPAIVNLFQVWVAPESRGHGLAARLLDASVNWARARDATIVQLGVTCGDSPAMRLYTRAGFLNHGSPEPLRPGAAILSQPMRLMLPR
jgi:GNAT superfamily N-acetyltransferase